MGRTRRESIPREVHKNLVSRLARERSKHNDKIADQREARENPQRDKMQSREKYFFYSADTLQDYEREAVQVCRWANARAGHRLEFDEVSAYLVDYLTERKADAEAGRITPRTLAKERAQLSKCWMQNLDGFEILPCRAESDKGRARDPYWNPENHADAVEFYRMIGARKSEYHTMSAEEFRHYAPQVEAVAGFIPRADLHGRVSNIQPITDERGQVCAVVVCHAKHGKSNITEIHPDDRERLTAIFNRGDFYQWFNPSSHTNVHQCRREYAQRMYEHYRRDTRTLPERELYRCRDGSGRVYDRQAVARVSVSLGHTPGDLFDTIHNYLR